MPARNFGDHERLDAPTENYASAPVPDLRELRYFVRLSEELHFGRAAGELYLSQSALSHAIRRLEVKTGCALFERGRGGVTLTDAGRQLVQEARRVISSAEQFTARAGAIRSGVGNQIVIGYVPAIQESAARDLEESSLRTGTLFDHVRASQDLTLRGLEDGRLDIAILHAGSLRPSLGALRYRSLPLVAVVGPAHPLAEHGAVGLSELEPYPMAFVRRVEWDLISTLFARRGLVASQLSVADPVGRAPFGLLHRDPRSVWLQTREFGSTGNLATLELEPSVDIEFEVVSKTSNDKPEVVEFAKQLHLLGTRGRSRELLSV